MQIAKKVPRNHYLLLSFEQHSKLDGEVFPASMPRCVLEPSQTSIKDLFTKGVNSFKTLTIFAKQFIVDPTWF